MSRHRSRENWVKSSSSFTQAKNDKEKVEEIKSKIKIKKAKRLN